MDALLRQLRAGPDGTVEYQDTELTGAVLSLGSAADCTIQLLGEGIAAHHATFRSSGGHLSLACQRPAKVRVNGRQVSSAALKTGDLLEIGGHRLRVLEPP